MGLTDDADRLVRTYSGGMQRKLDLGASLVGAPRLLLLDEPTTGLDPRSRNELWVAIEDLASRGTDVLLTTQYLDEADRLAHIIAIIDHGKLVASGTSNELKAQLGRDVVDVHVTDDADLERAAQALGPEATIDAGELTRLASGHDGADELVAAVQALGTAGIRLDDVALRRPTLDDVFLTLTGKATEKPSPDAATAAKKKGKNDCHFRAHPYPDPRADPHRRSRHDRVHDRRPHHAEVAAHAAGVRHRRGAEHRVRTDVPLRARRRHRRR